MVGAGVLGLPSAMVYLGWAGGTVTLVLSFFISVSHCCSILIKSCWFEINISQGTLLLVELEKNLVCYKLQHL